MSREEMSEGTSPSGRDDDGQESSAEEVTEEGCLSVPGPYAELARAFRARVDGVQLGQRALLAPTVLVTNQNTLSDGEDFTEGYRELQLGQVIEQRWRHPPGAAALGHLARR